MFGQKSPEALVRAFDAALPTDARSERRLMFGFPAAFANGNMFAGLWSEHMIVRLPEADRAALLALDGARVFEPMPGRPMREYVMLPPAIVADPRELADWTAKAFRYASSLPAKAAKAKTPKAKAAKKGTSKVAAAPSAKKGPIGGVRATGRRSVAAKGAAKKAAGAKAKPQEKG